jgi:hypothetical protein
VLLIEIPVIESIGPMILNIATKNVGTSNGSIAA